MWWKLWSTVLLSDDSSFGWYLNGRSKCYLGNDILFWLWGLISDFNMNWFLKGKKTKKSSFNILRLKKCKLPKTVFTINTPPPIIFSVYVSMLYLSNNSLLALDTSLCLFPEPPVFFPKIHTKILHGDEF